MKPRTILTVILVAGITVGAVWLFNKPAPAPVKVAETPKPAASKPAVAAPKMQVAAPTTAPAPKSAPSTTPAPSTSPTSTGQAIVELNTTFDDMTMKLQSGDLIGLFEAYAPPDQLARMTPEMKTQMEQQMQMAMSDPQAQQQLQMMVGILQNLKTQTPTLNDAGDKATYQVDPPPGMAPPGTNVSAQPVTFTKQNGKWYISNGPGGM